MISRFLQVQLLRLACFALLFVGSVHAQDKSMNVLFILADDLGWADTTLYGHTSLYETPNIERLAKRGMTFTRAYSNSPLCSPTRASVMTGQAVARHGSTAPQHHLGLVRLQAEVQANAPPSNKSLQCESVSRLDTTIPSLGKLVKQSGYATAHFGKWHLGPAPYSPLQHGFDLDLPHHPGPGPAGSFVAPWSYDGGRFTPNHPQEHIEDRMAEEAVKWLESLSGDKPFFMNYWQFSVHAPFDAKQELIDRYRPKIDRGNPQHSPTYAAMVHSLDDSVGALLDALQRTGANDRTVIVFVSDNGGNMYNGIPETDVDGNPFIVAPTSNSPLRGGKATMFEGGIRVPCVVVWPGVTEPGSRSDEPIQTSDFYPTLLQQFGIPIPKDHAVDGIDITPALKGGQLQRDAIFTYFPHSPPVPDWLPPSISVHSGDWKLIRLFHQGENAAHDHLLYNLKDDIGERTNLASRYPDKVQQLDQLIEQHIESTGAVTPQPNPNFDPAKYNPKSIGIQPGGLRVAGQPSKPAANQNAALPSTVVDGWRSGGTCTIKKDNGLLAINSTGGDPYVHAEKIGDRSDGPFTVSLRIKSDAGGLADLFFNHPFNKVRTVSFPLKHNDQWQEYQIKIPANSLDGLRIDPATRAGIIEIDWIRLLNASGETIANWEFDHAGD